jgi:hypothetical protein
MMERDLKSKAAKKGFDDRETLQDAQIKIKQQKEEIFGLQNLNNAIK